ncbi:uncharacterized protein LOC119412192 [Nematolebias whitei]|uniref:uncharacterized protein LOC119412192 n=1 Tax=Nematolebias whitei TaxID=451745 RepID=UPI00189AF89E|nr:uncharacterized protein LOC119412192 [Nematolebias whitei]
MNWLQMLKKPTKDNSSKSDSSVSSDFLGSSDNIFPSTERQHDRQSIQGSGSYSDPMPEQPEQRNKPSTPKYTAEVAATILKDYGLEKDDLELLLSYPEDQLTSDNLPNILKQICLQKQKKTTTTQPYSDPQPSPSFTGIDRSSSTRQTGICKEIVPPNPLKISQVIEYGHKGKFTLAGKQAEKTSRVISGEIEPRRFKDQPPKGTPEVKSGAMVSSLDQMGSTPSVSSSSDPTRSLQTQPGQAPKRTFTLFPILKKDTEGYKSESLKSMTSQKPEQDSQMSLPTGPQFHREQLVASKQQDKGKQVPREQKSQQNNTTDSTKQQMQPGVSQPAQSGATVSTFVQPPTSGQSFVGTVTVKKRLPPGCKIRDCAGVLPKKFPHVCTQCDTTCFKAAEWEPHCKSRHHVLNVTNFLKEYPDLNKQSSPTDSTPKRFSFSFTTASSVKSKIIKPGHGSRSRSRSHSPSRSRDRQDRSRDRSRSFSPRRHRKRRRSASLSRSRSRSRSRSPRRSRRYSDSTKTEEKKTESSFRRREERLPSPRRSRERKTSSERSTPHRKRSTSRDNLARKPIETSKMAVQGVKPTPGKAVQGVKPTPGKAVQGVKPIPGKAVQGVKPTPGKAVQGVKPAPGKAVQGVKPAPGKAVQGVKPAPGKAVQGVKPAPGKAVQGVKPAPESKTPAAAKTDVESSRVEPNDSELEEVIKILTPAFQAELKTSSSSSSKSEMRSPDRDKLVMLTGVYPFVSYMDLRNALELFGKTETVVQYKAKHQAYAIFVKTEDADKLRSIKSFNLKGSTVTVGSVDRVNLLASSIEAKAQEQRQQRSKETGSSSDAKTSSVKSKGTSKTSAGPSSEASWELKTGRLALICVSFSLYVSAQKVVAAGDKPVHKWDSKYNYFMDPVSSVTVGDQVEKFFHKKDLECSLSLDNCLKSSFHERLLLITNLPDSGYSEEDISCLLHPFGFKYSSVNLYIIPQIGIAYANMPSTQEMKAVLKQTWDGVTFKGRELTLRPFQHPVSMTPFRFYKHLMKQMGFEVTDDGCRTIFLQNISPAEIKEVREVVFKNFSVRNFLPLLDKLYVEFKSIDDTDLLGLWYSQMDYGYQHKLFRLKPPHVPSKTPIKPNLPQGTVPPFWITMKIAPYAFPTLTPWFNIPECIIIDKPTSVLKQSFENLNSFTIMLTGLPEEGYQHEQIVKRVWSHLFPKTIQTLYSDVIVLPMQRRAFVFFSNWSSCNAFIQEHFKNKGDDAMKIFFVPKLNAPGSEKRIYQNMMKLANTEIPDSYFLDERILCIETFDASISFAVSIVKVVASIAPLENYLPLGNRIFIEMNSASAVTKVVQELSTVDYYSQNNRWSEVGRIESLKTAQERLWSTGSLRIDLQMYLRTTKNQFLKERWEKCKIAPVVSEFPSRYTVSGFTKAEPVDKTLKNSEKLKNEISNPDTCSLAAVSEKLPDTHKSPKEDDTPSVSGVAKSDLEVPKDVNAAKTDESKMEMPSETDSPGKKSKTGKGKETDEGTEKINVNVVVSVEEAAPTEVSDRQPNNMGVKEDKKISNQTEPEQLGAEEETTIIMLDSPKDGPATNKPMVARSTGAESEIIIIDDEDVEPKEDDTPTERKPKPTRDSKEDGEKTLQTEVPSQESSPTETCEAVVTDPGEEEGIYVILDIVEEEDVDEDQPKIQKPKSGNSLGPSKMESRTETKEKTDGDTEKMDLNMVDSLQDKPVPEVAVTDGSGGEQANGKVKEVEQISSQTKPEQLDAEKEPSTEISDSLKEQLATEEPSIPRTTRARRGKAKTDVEDKIPKKRETSTRRKTPPSRDSHEKGEKTLQEEDKTPQTDVLLQESSPTEAYDALVTDPGEEESTYVILDAVEEEDVDEDQPSTQMPMVQEPTEDTKTIKKQTAVSQSEDLSSIAADEDDLWQILDSVEDGTMNEEPHSEESNSETKSTVSEGDVRQTKKRARSLEKKSRQQIADSLNDQIKDGLVTKGVPKTETDDKPDQGEAEKTASAKCKLDIRTEESLTSVTPQEFGKTEEEESEATTTRTRGRPRKKARKTPVRKSTRGKTVSAEDEREEEENESLLPTSVDSSSTPIKDSSVLNVSNIQIQEMKVEPEPKTVSSEQQLQSESPDGQKQEGHEDEEEEGHNMDESTVFMKKLIEPDADGSCLETSNVIAEFEQLPFDADAPADDQPEPLSRSEAETQEETTEETQDSLRPENSLNEADGTEEEKPEKPKHDDITEESLTSETTEELGKTEEEENEATPRTRGRPGKRTRKAAVRKSTRGKTVSAEDEREEEENESLLPASVDSSSTSIKDPSAPSDVQVQETKVEPEPETVSADQQLQSESPDGQKLEGREDQEEEEEEEEHSKAEVKEPAAEDKEAASEPEISTDDQPEPPSRSEAETQEESAEETRDSQKPETSLDEAGGAEEEKPDQDEAEKTSAKRKRDDVTVCKQTKALDEPRAKRSRSLSPRGTANFKLPPFDPARPLGEEET